MILKNKRPWLPDEYFCEITDFLDKESGIVKSAGYPHGYHHYVLYDSKDFKKGCLAIRVPGGTVGALYLTDDSKVDSVVVDTNYVVKTYPKNINELLKVFEGKQIEVE